MRILFHHAARLSGSRQHCCSGLSGHVTLMLGIVFSFNESGTSTQGFAVGLCSRQTKPDRFMGPHGLVGFIYSFSHFQLGVNGRCCNDPARQAAYSTDKYRISSQSAILAAVYTSGYRRIYIILLRSSLFVVLSEATEATAALAIMVVRIILVPLHCLIFHFFPLTTLVFLQQSHLHDTMTKYRKYRRKHYAIGRQTIRNGSHERAEKEGTMRQPEKRT